MKYGSTLAVLGAVCTSVYGSPVARISPTIERRSPQAPVAQGGLIGTNYDIDSSAVGYQVTLKTNSAIKVQGINDPTANFTLIHFRTCRDTKLNGYMAQNGTLYPNATYGQMQDDGYSAWGKGANGQRNLSSVIVDTASSLQTKAIGWIAKANVTEADGTKVNITGLRNGTESYGWALAQLFFTKSADAAKPRQQQNSTVVAPALFSNVTLYTYGSGGDSPLQWGIRLASAPIPGTNSEYSAAAWAISTTAMIWLQAGVIMALANSKAFKEQQDYATLWASLSSLNTMYSAVWAGNITPDIQTASIAEVQKAIELSSKGLPPTLPGDKEWQATPGATLSATLIKNANDASKQCKSE